MKQTSCGAALLGPLCFLLLLSCFSTHAQLRQVHLDTLLKENEIQKISFYTNTEGYLAADGAGYPMVAFTADSGHTFTQRPISNNVDYNGYAVNLTFGFRINGVKAFDQQELVAYGHYGLVPAILHSVNGGVSWLLVFLSQYNSSLLPFGGVVDMVFPGNGATGFAIDADRILMTVNKGLSWSVARSDAGAYFRSLTAAGNAVFAATDTRLLSSADAGASWQSLAVPATYITAAYFLTAGKGWLSAYNDSYTKGIFYTSNGGVSWTQQNDFDATGFNCSRMLFTDDSTGFAIGDGFTTYKTTDAGKIWEPLKRDNNYSYLGYYHHDIQAISKTQFWCGGVSDFLELSTNAGGTPYPKAFFKIDTNGLSATHIVNLKNFSKAGYTFKWYKNNVLLSTGYNASYAYTSNALDSIKLVAFNGSDSNSVKKVVYIRSGPTIPVNSFFPLHGGKGSQITIKGSKFTSSFYVGFGGVAGSSLQFISDSVIIATVADGASGDVLVKSPSGIGSLPGFVFIPAPVINSFSPISAAAGSTVIINGVNLLETSAVLFGSVTASSFTVLSNNSIAAVIPPGAVSGLVTVITTGGTATKAGFVSVPVIAAFSPLRGTTGTILSIDGSGFSNDITGISIGGIPVLSFTRSSGTHITAIVGEGGSGNVSISAAGGNTSLAAFTWLAPPVINSFSPANGPIGTAVTISGSGFDPIPANNIVYFGQVKATVTAAGAGALTVTVPPGASFDPISVVNSNNLIAYAAYPFLVTFTGGGSITENSFDSLRINMTGNPTRTVAVADLDGDGKTDIIATHYTASDFNRDIFIYRNTSSATAASFDGPFRLPNLTNADVYPADLDADGKPDLVVMLSDSVVVLKNNSVPGSFSFVQVVTFPTQGGSYNSVDIKDIDGDGKADIAIDNYTLPANVGQGGCAVLRNIGEPGKMAFAAPLFLPINGTRGMLLVDLDGDRKPELILPNGQYNNSGIGSAISILKNTSTKSNVSFSTPIILKGPGHSFLAAGDLDGDGKIDLVGTDNDSLQLALYRFTGTGGNIAFANPVILPSNYPPDPMLVADMDGDGKLDLVTGLSQVRMSIYKNNSQPGSFSFAAKVDYTTRPYWEERHVQLADFNGDGKMDAVSTSSIEQNLMVYLNKVSPAPGITRFAPQAGLAGTTITITGHNFTGITAVGFGNTAAASFVVLSDSTITAVVASGTSGSVTVTNQYGTGMLAGFVYGYIARTAAIKICLGQDTSLQAKLNGTQYQWQQDSGSGFGNINDNSNFIGTHAANLQLKNLSAAMNNYQYRCITDGLQDSIAYQLTIQSSVTPIVTIATATTTICAGATANFSLSAVNNAGTSPLYQWQVNDVNVNTGINSNVYSTATLPVGINKIKMLMTSSAACAVPVTVSSNVLQVTVNGPQAPSIQVSGTTSLAAGASAVFTAVTLNRAVPSRLQWQDSTGSAGWLNLSAATDSTVTYKPAKTGDKLRCVLFGTYTCSAITSFTSNALSFTVSPVTAVPTVPAASYGIKSYPNPAHDVFYIDSLTLTDRWETIDITSIIGGQKIISVNISGQTSVAIPVGKLSAGYYYAILKRSKGSMAVIKFLKL